LVIEKFSKSVNHTKLQHLKTSKIGLGTAAIGRPIYININENKVDSSEKFDLEHYKQQGLDFLKEAMSLGVKYFDSSPGYGIAEDILIELIKEKMLMRLVFLQNGDTPILQILILMLQFTKIKTIL
jgi:aryl-alcohol dehydrogenase-like predicted oxidoreductase